MRPNQRETAYSFNRRFASLPLPLLLMLTAGCFYRNMAYRGIQASRSDAYEKWLDVQQGSRKPKPVIQGKLSLEDAIKVGLQHNKKLLSALQEQYKAEGQSWASYAAVLPSVSVEGKYTRLDDSIAMDFGGQKVPLQTLNNYSVDLYVKQPLFSGGAIPATLRSGQLAAVISDEVVREAVQKTIFSITQTYYEILLAQKLYKTYEDAVRSAEASLDEVTKKRRQGMATPYDMLRAKVELSNFQASMIRQQNTIEVTTAKLLKEMGTSRESDIELATAFSYTQNATSLKEAVKRAFENRPELLRAELEVKLQEEDCRIAYSRYLPRFFGFFTQTWGRPEPTLFGDTGSWGDQWIAGIGASMPLFDGLMREGEIKQKHAALHQKELNVQDVQEQVVFEVQQALANLKNARQLVETQKLNIDRAAEALRSVEIGYREGYNSSVELTDARAALTKAKGLYSESLFQHVTAKLQLQLATGILGKLSPQSQPE